MKKLLAIETAKSAVLTQWTKKIIIEKQVLSNDDMKEPLVSINVLRLPFLIIKVFFIKILAALILREQIHI